MERFGQLIDGVEDDTNRGGTFVSHDPATDHAVAEFPLGDATDIDRAVHAARRAHEQVWRHTSATERGRLLSAVAARLRQDAEQLAVDETRDCGKPLSQARADVELAARYFEFFGSAVVALHGDQLPVNNTVFDFTVREPYGVCGQINAWNFPLNMAARSLAPALATGNTAVLKPPELAPFTTAMLGRFMTEVGFPAGVVNIVHGSGATAGAALSSHTEVDLLTFTGSVGTGKVVAAAAAQAVTPCVLEMGGKSPVLVLDDADLDTAAQQLAHGFIESGGQSCDLPSLALVHEHVYDEFVERLVQHASAFTIGPGIDDPDVAALITSAQRDRVENYVTGAVEAGARIALGGSRPSSPKTADGWFVQPTILVDARPEMAVAREEIFGPVLTVVRVRDEQEAVSIANGTGYGLAGFVWTEKSRRGLRLTRQVRAGQVYLNCFSSGDSVMTPFGGFGLSGYGREKGFEALRTYTQTKNICLAAG